METRKITIVSSATQQKYVVNTNAETLGQLKAAMRAEGINYTDMTFLEGLTKTELVSDDSVLPTNVQYKGTTTNELVFMLTKTSKKVRSGAMSRREAYDAIVKYDLQSVVVEKFGRNYTQVPTLGLIEVVNAHLAEPKDADQSINDCDGITLHDVLEKLYAIDRKLDIIMGNAGHTPTCACKTETKVEEAPYSDKDIDDMFDFL